MPDRSHLRLCEVALVPVFITAALSGCAIRAAESSDHARTNRITIDGSSTVFPITQAVAEGFSQHRPRVSVTVGRSGTGGGFKRFIADELDICDASRPIEPSEIDACAQNGIHYLELPIAMDGLTVVVNPHNTWCDSLTVDQLKRLWVSGSTITRWSQLDPSFPNREIVLYGPDVDSGTFEYFTEVVCGKKGRIRPDYTSSADDNLLVQGVMGDVGSLGYFGYAYYHLNRRELKSVCIGTAGEGTVAVAPSADTIRDGSYHPLSRPLFLFVNRDALRRPAVVSFINYYLDNGPALIAEVDYVPLTPERYGECRARLKAALRDL